MGQNHVFLDVKMPLYPIFSPQQYSFSPAYVLIFKFSSVILLVSWRLQKIEWF